MFTVKFTEDGHACYTQWKEDKAEWPFWPIQNEVQETVKIPTFTKLLEYLHNVVDMRMLDDEGGKLELLDPKYHTYLKKNDSLQDAMLVVVLYDTGDDVREDTGYIIFTITES